MGKVNTQFAISQQTSKVFASLTLRIGFFRVLNMAIMYYVSASTCLANKLTKVQPKKSFQSSLGINEASCYLLRDVSNV